MNPATPTVNDGPRAPGPSGSGSIQLDDDRRARLIRMADNLKRDLMRQDGLGPDLRAACLARVERWLAEASGVI